MRRGSSGGFSLLEILVVVAIIGIFVGVAMLSVDVTGSDRQSEQEVVRLRGLIELVREEALLQSRDYGLLFNENSYRFYYYDYDRLAWLAPVDDRLLAARELVEPLSFELAVEDRGVQLDPDATDSDDDTPEPQVMILSSGEMTPFVAEVFRSIGGGRYRLSAEFDGSMEVDSLDF